LIVEIINCVFGVKIKLLPQLLRPKMQKIEKSTVFITSSKKSSFYIETFLYISRRINIIDFIMKKIFILACILLGIQFQSVSQITWDGGGSTNNWGEAANWSGNTLPITSDNVVFDNTSAKNCIMNTAINVNDITVASNYSGIISSNSAGKLIRGNLTISGGTFSCTSGNLTIRKNFTFNGGTFLNNGGTVILEVDNSLATVITGAPTFNILRLEDVGSGELFFNFGTSTVSTLYLDNSSDGATWSFSGNIAVQNELNILGASTAIPTTNTSIITLNGAGPITVNGAALAGDMLLNDIVINTSGDVIFVDNINLSGNWTGTQGTLTAGTSTVNMYGTSASISGTAAAFDNLTLQSGALVTFPASEQVSLTGSFDCTGATANFPTTTTLGLNGTTAQNIIGNGFTIGGIHTYSNSGGRTITFSAPVTILDFLDVDGTSMTIATGTNLTLNSSNALTARLGPLGSGSSITGNVTVETMVPSGTTGWALLGPRGVDGQTIAGWDTYVSSGGTTGLPMTCTLCANHPSVIGTGTAAFVSVQGWNEPGGSYTELIATDPLTPGVGIWAYVGDGFLTTNPLKLINTGTLKTGLVSIPLTAGGPQSGFNLVANPYPSPISWNLVMLNVNNIFNVNDAIYAFDANSGAYTQFVAGFGTPGAPSGIDDVIAGGQGFYIEAPGGGSIEFEESHKVTSNTSANPLIRGASTASVGQTFRLKIVGINDHDEAGFRIHGNATADFDKKYDAKKIFQSPGYVGYPGAYSKYTTISSKDDNGIDYSIQSLPPLTNALNIPLLARVSTTGSYTISAFDFQDFAMCVGLIDKLDNSYHDLRLSPYVFTISDTTSTPRFELVLCKDESLNALGISEATESNSIFITQDAQGAFVKTVFEKNTKATISVFNIIGQKLMKDVTVEGMVTNTALPIELHNQVVIIKVITDKETVTKKIVLH
jgi:hypothetical protein